MYMMTDSMHTLSPLIRTVCGGIGAGTILMAVAGDSAGDGVRHGTIIVGMVPVTGAAIGVVIGATIITITIIRIIPVTVGAVATGEVVMDGMAQADVIRGYMPEDITIVIVRPVRVGIIM